MSLPLMMGAGGGSFVSREGIKQPMPDRDITVGLTFDQIHEASYDPHARVEIMDKMGVWAQIMCPNTMGFGAGRLVQHADRELARTIVSIYNDACIEFQEQSGNQVFPMAGIPFWDIEGSVAEVERIKGLGLKGITTAGNPNLGGLPDLGQPDWNPLWEAVVEADLPVNIHMDNVMWESDFPHPTCLYPSPLERTAEALKDMPAVSVRKVMQDNAVKLYKLELPSS